MYLSYQLVFFAGFLRHQQYLKGKNMYLQKVSKQEGIRFFAGGQKTMEVSRMFFFGGRTSIRYGYLGYLRLETCRVACFLTEHVYSWVFRCKVDGTHIVEAPGVTKWCLSVGFKMKEWNSATIQEWRQLLFPTSLLVGAASFKEVLYIWMFPKMVIPPNQPF